MDKYDNLRIFTETNENIGIVFNQYKDIPDKIDEFLDMLEEKAKILVKDPTSVTIDLREDINEFKEFIDRDFEPEAIEVYNIKYMKNEIKSLRDDLDRILNRYKKIKDSIAFGGDYLRAILFRPKVYSKDIDEEKYDIINRNIRNVNRGLDWVEKVIIDLYNMIDQDLNILTIVNKVYVKTNIYEYTNEDTLYRITSNGVGIYEVLKQRMSAKNWKEFLDSDACKWLPKPDKYTAQCRSYFTKAGIDKYNELVAPIVDKVIGNNITFETFKKEDIGDIIYQDEYQIVADFMIYSAKDSKVYDPPLPVDQLPDHLKNDPIHVWRAETGIELIHKEPTKEELDRIWANWQLMTNEQKKTSDAKSIELFGVDNKTHYHQLCIEYISESIDVIDRFVNDEEFQESYYYEKSHGKLKYDFRAARDIRTGHQIKIVYELDNMKFIDAEYGSFNFNSMANRKMPFGDNESKVNFIKNKGNLDHKSSGQKVVAIIDVKTNKRLNEADCLGIYNYEGIDLDYLINDRKFSVDEIKDYIKKRGSSWFHVKVGEIDDSASFKSTFWPKGKKYVNKTELNQREFIGIGRGAKVNDLESLYTYAHPSKKDIKEHPRMYNDFAGNQNHYRASRKDQRHSLLKERIEFTESSLDETFEDINTPEDLLKWMDCIQYGWISKKDKKVYGTGEDDDEEIFFKEYFLQSPSDLIQSKTGVCWDQTELERDWFKFYYSCNFAIIYIEIKDGSNCPTHTFLIYEDEKGKGTHWFEHSWGQFKGIHTYKNFMECITDVVNKHQKFNNDTESPIEIHYLRDLPRLNSSCEEFMKYASNQPLLDPSQWSPDTEWEDVFKSKNLFKESYDLETLPNILYFGTPNKLDSKTIAAETPRGLFMTPHIGLASMFIIDRSKVAKEYFNSILAKNKREMYRSSYNIEYKEWEYSDDQLKNPLSKVHMYHNIPQFKEIGSGSSSGYIYAIDVSSVKNDLGLYKDSSANREVVYKGTARLPIKEVTEHKIDWEITYRKSLDGKIGTFESKPIKESVIYECGIRKGSGIDGDDLKWLDQYLKEEGESYTPPTEEPKKKSMPKQIDEAESDKNGVRRKKLYIAFIEWCKAYNNKNTFGSIFDKDAFKVTYPFIPNEMRYFYRLANPLLCVLSGELTFFQASELRKLNAKNSHLNEMMIFAATPNDVRVFNNKDKKVYRGIDKNGSLELGEALAGSFDLYIQKMISKGDILNGPIDEESESNDQT